jgi:BirA family biotin operon repressor/biotin-[acetyl-CoA-carboxylase] ligase
MNGLGLPHLHLRLTDSTNERARELADRGAPHGTLVTADEQTAGRGREGRRWSAPAGSSLLVSLVLREYGPLTSLAAGVAVCRTVGGEARIKWPNDVVVAQADGRLAKLAGILVEGRPQHGWVVLGIGINAAVDLASLPAELAADGPRPAASLGLAPAEVPRLLGRLLAELQTCLAAPAAQTVAAVRSLDALAGSTVAWEDGSGTAAGIDDDGALLVRDGAGKLARLMAGEVRLSR